jgi:DICT domain-containing protein
MHNTPIAPDLSVYALVEERTTTERILPNHRRTMLIASHEIENAVIIDKVRARVFAGFQRMSHFLPQVRRYRRLAENAESVYVFGIMDVEPPLIHNVQYIPLAEADQLAKEWFLLVDSPDYYSLLTTEESSKADTPADERVFWGVWSYDDETITVIQEWLTNLVGARPLVNVPAHRNYRRQLGLMSNAMIRLSQLLMQSMIQPHPQSRIIAQEVKLMLEQYVDPGVRAATAKLNKA